MYNIYGTIEFNADTVQKWSSYKAAFRRAGIGLPGLTLDCVFCKRCVTLFYAIHGIDRAAFRVNLIVRIIIPVACNCSIEGLSACTKCMPESNGGVTNVKYKNP